MKRVLLLFLVFFAVSAKAQTLNFINKTSTSENWQTLTLLAGKTDFKVFYNDHEKNLQELKLVESGETKGQPWFKVQFPDESNYFMVFYAGKIDLTDNKVHQEFILEEKLKETSSFSMSDVLGGVFKTMLLGL